MGVVKILITDEIDDDCVILVNYDGVISDKLKDVLTSEEMQKVIINHLAEKDFFAENTQ